MIYNRIRVIDGDTIDLQLWPSMLWEKCRIIGVDTDELGTKRGEDQKKRLESFNHSIYVKLLYTKTKSRRRLKRDAYGRLLVKLYVWRWWRYVNYAEWMKSKGYIKKGSKWNDESG